MASIEKNRSIAQDLIAAGKLQPATNPSTDKLPIPVSQIANYPLAPNPYLRTPLPASYSQQPDQQRQWQNNGSIPQVRIPPTSVTSSSLTGAQSASQASTAINTVLPGTVGTGGTAGILAPATLDNVADSPTYGRVTSTALTNHSIDPSKVGVLSIGSRPQSTTTALTYTTTTTSITLYWDGTNGSTTLTIYRDDGTIVGPFSGNQTITGLSANTLYYVYSYFDELSNTVQFASVVGAVGTPAYAYTAPNLLAAQQQILRTRIPLALIIATTGFTTPASGTGGGSGGGGGGGGGHRYV